MEMESSMNLNGATGYGSTGKYAVDPSTYFDIMEIDNTTYEDLSLFSRHEEFSIFHKLDFTRTKTGRDLLLESFANPLSKLEDIYATQRILELILKRLDQWPGSISNGTIMVMEKFYETAIDDIPAAHNLSAAIGYKIFHSADYAMVRYSVGHFADFVRGMDQLVKLLDAPDSPRLLTELMERARRLLDQEVLRGMIKTTPGVKYNPIQIIYYGHFVRVRFKTAMQSLIEIHSRLDAWYSMAMATRRFNLSFPVFVDQAEPYVEATSLYHLLLPQPVAYDVRLDRDSNFLFLTGANMAGKSTFIRAVGAVVFLAHLGMGVPAATMRLSLFDGILSNINVMDNISKGESFFFNEVQRIRNTLEKINGQKKWLVLIDELFKGTNVQDAMKCSTAVIKGLIRIRRSLFILSTHLYEIGDDLKGYPNILFRYFETNVVDDQLEFSYQLKNGISNDRIGYLILKREKVVEMLERL
ncbi:MAG TPA: DNA mismatch repair protein MutS [Puia sp.]|jgi:DNA mismatch repair protein MutS|nr:DNA mismatch repair protein MutS [Puia sp.]